MKSISIKNCMFYKLFQITFILFLAFPLACSINQSDSNLENTQNIQSENYTAERVVYGSEGIELSGILWLPKTPGPHPAIVIVDGSGETLAERYQPWIEKYFLEWGIACLSYDKRGVGKSEGNYLGKLSIDLPLLGKDAAAGVKYLTTRKEIDRSKIGLLGGSQAGWVIPVAAVQNNDVSFTLIFGGTTLTLGEEDYYSRLAGDDPFWKFIYWNLSDDEISIILTEKGPSMFDPLPYLLNMNVPGLWLYGDRDRSQPTKESIILLVKLIKDYGKDFDYRVFKGANHSFRVGKNDEYAEGFFDTMKTFLKSQIEK